MTRGPQERLYRRWVRSQAGMKSFRIRDGESDLHIQAESDLTSVAREHLTEIRGRLQTHIQAHPGFRNSLQPVKAVSAPVPPVIRAMISASDRAGVGPMAAVAGAVAQSLGEVLRKRSPRLIVENGGDIYLQIEKPPVVALYCGDNSPFSGTLGFLPPDDHSRLGICTSSATIGHSLSLGRADAATVICTSAALADAMATALANRISHPGDIEAALDWAASRGDLLGAIAVIGDHIGFRGDIRILPL